MQGVIFGRILEMSLVGCYSILVVLLVRLILRGCARKYSYWLWLIVFVNLSLPFAPRGGFSLIPGRVAEFSVEQGLAGGKLEETPDVKPGNAEEPETVRSFTESGELISETSAQMVPAREAVGTGGEKQTGAEAPGQAKRGIWILPMAELVWLAGIFLLVLYNLAAVLRMRGRLCQSTQKGRDRKRRIVVLEGISTPFLWGFLHPIICLPTGMDEAERTYIIAHEECHRRRGDQFVKLFAFAVTILHWFNPLVWLAYALCCKDMEISCDEAVLEKSRKNIRKEYAASLLKYAAKQNGYVLTPLTFGEPSVKARIKNVLRYKKKGLIFSVLALLLLTAVALGLTFRPSKEAGKASGETVQSGTEGQEKPSAEPVEKGPVISNNGGAVVAIGRTLYYMQGLPIYTDGQYLYVTKSAGDETFCYKLDGSGFKKLFDGNIVGIREDRQELYYENRSTSSSPMIYSFDLKTEESTQLTAAAYLGGDADTLYVRRSEASGTYLDTVDKYSHEVKQNILKTNLPGEEIKSFCAVGDTLLFAAGSVEGSMGIFNGDFYSYSRTDGTLRQAHLTDSGRFLVEAAQGGIYYQAYENQGVGGSVLCRANYFLEKTDELGADLELLGMDEARGAILVGKPSEKNRLIQNLILLDAKTGEETLLLDMEAQNWELQANDKLQFADLDFVGETLFVKADQWGWREGNGWRDELIREEYFRVNLDGSGAKSWNPNEAAFETANKGVTAGTPVDPAKEGWNLTRIEDVRENFSRMNPEEKVNPERTLLLGQTDTYTLYGRGDFETMLLEHEGQYAQISYPFTSNYMIPVDLNETDYDHDGSPELSIKIQVKHGTGVYIDTLFMADADETGALYAYEFEEENYLAQLRAHLTFEETDRGTQPLVDGLPAGVPLQKSTEGSPVEDVNVGGQIRFFHDEDGLYISAGLEFWIEGQIGIADYNGSDMTARVRYDDGGHFNLGAFTSRDLGLEDKTAYVLHEYYLGGYTNEKGVAFSYTGEKAAVLTKLDFAYDTQEASEGLVKVIATVLPEEKDSYDYASVTLRFAGIGGSYQWIAEDIYLEK